MHSCFSLAVGALALAAAFPSTAAQEMESGTILVTASRFPDSQFSAPIGSRVITADEIKMSGASNVAEALNKLGGIHVRQDLFGGSNPGLDLRGFGVTGDKNTLVLVDGVRLSENELAAARLSGVSLESVERIEIVSGGAVLYGSNSTGGVINIITKQGRLNTREANISVGAGNFGTRDLRGSATVSGEHVSFNANVQDYHSDNERQNNNVDQRNANATLALRLQDSNLALNFGSENNRSRMPGARTESQWRTDPRGTSTPDDFSNTDLWYVGLSGSQRIGEFELAANLTRRDRNTEYFAAGAFFGTPFFNADHRRVTSDEFSPRLKWSRDVAGHANELVVGYDWRSWDFQSRKHDDFGFGFAGPSLENGTQKTEGWYFQNSLQATATTQVSFGARTESLKNTRDVPYALTMIPTSQTTDRDLDAWSIGVKQTLARGLNAHARTGTSYRIANIDEDRCYTAPCALLKPQTSRDHEVGLAWTGRDTTASVVLFRMEIEDELYYNRLAGAFGSNVNLPPTRRQGVELAGSWDPFATLSLTGRYALTDATFRSGTFSGVDISGKAVPAAPRHRASIGANWLVTAFDRLNFGINYVGPQQYDNDPANRFATMPSYTTVDAKYSRVIGDATLSLAVNNLFDKTYYSYALVNSATNPTTFNAYPDLSRKVMATFEYKFR